MPKGSPVGCVRAREQWLSCRAADEIELAADATLDEVVRHYIRWHRPLAKAELDYYAALPSVAEAKRRAGRAERPDGKRHAHQTRIARAALGQSAQQLAPLRVDRCRSFEELHGLLEEAIGRIRGVGALTVYDTALRVGAKLGHFPDRVYLHAGVRKGATALELGRGRPYLLVEELPSPFQRLAPHEIEDCLCIYKDQLAAAAHKPG